MKALPVLDARAAGIDVGSEALHVSVAGDSPQIFGTMTGDLLALKDWLKRQEVTSVAVEATGVYWLCLYEVLEAAGIKVLVVNGRHVRNLPGRKTDISDCQWLATLHAHGLLRSGFVPEADIRRLQDYVRLRDDHIRMAASHVQHMQKALERMNLKIHDVISSLTGKSGMQLIKAIVAGERNPDRLLALCDKQIRKRKEKRLREALRGTWKAEHMFALRQAVEGYEFYQRQIKECDQAMAEVLREMQQNGPQDGPPAGSVKPTKAMNSVNAPDIADLHWLLYTLCGCKDPTTLPGLGDYTLLQLIAEVGLDLTLWPTPKHFTSWLGLAPGNNQSGKRRGNSKKQRNRAGRIFCLIARALARSVDMAFGGFYRQLRNRKGGLIANQALARKLAEQFWRIMVYGTEFVEHGLQQYQERVAQTQLAALKRLASKHGFALAPLQAAPTVVHG